MVAAVHITASVVKLLTFGVVLGLQWVCKQRGLVTSGILLLFWALSAIFGAVTFRSVLNSGHLFSAGEPEMSWNRMCVPRARWVMIHLVP